MYKFIVLGLGFLLLFGGAYLIKKSDKEGVLNYAFSKEIKVLPTVNTKEMISGVYKCDIENGCASPYVLILSDDNNVEMTTSYNDGVEIRKETGIWKLENGNLITILLTDLSSGEHYEIPHSILIQTVSTSTLTGLSYDKDFYFDMYKPVFVRQVNQDEERQP